jgi:predicted enzyme related to lactoylglutathione lyase
MRGVIMNLIGVQIGAEDAKKLAEFYEKAFGAPKWSMPDGWYGWDIGTGHLFFGPHSDIKGQAHEPQRIMISLEADDVTSEFARLVEAGAKEVAKPYNPDSTNKDFWLATVADPEGNYLQLSSPMQDAEASSN